MKRQRSDQEKEINRLGGFSILNEWGMEDDSNEDKSGQERKTGKRKKAL